MADEQFSLHDDEQDKQAGGAQEIKPIASDCPALQLMKCTEQEIEEHQQRLRVIKQISGKCLWKE